MTDPTPDFGSLRDFRSLSHQTVALVQTVDHLRALASAPAAAAALVVGLAPHLSLACAAAQAGRAYRPYTDYLTVAQFVQAADDARRLAADWLAPSSAAGQDPALAAALDSLGLELQQALNESLLARGIVARALDDLAPPALFLPAGLDPKVAAAARFEAARRGIAVHDLPPAAAPPAAARWAARGRRVALTLRPLGHNLPALARHRRLQRAAPRPVLLAFGAGVDSANQQRLMPALDAQAALRPIAVRLAPHGTALEASALNRPGGSDSPFLYFLPWHAMLGARRGLSRCRQELRRLRVRSTAESWLDPILERFFLHLLPHALATQRDAAALLDRLRPAVVLTSNEVSFPVRTLVLEAQRRHIATLGLVHSGLNNMYYRDFRSDRLAVWGEVHRRDFEQLLSKPPACLAPIGNPQYDTYACRPPAAARRCPHLLVVTAVSHWHMFYFDLRRHEQAWREIVRLAADGVQVTVKPHPRFDDYAFYSTLGPALADWRDDRPGVAVARHAFLEEVLPECDAVVVPNFPTTGAVEAMLCHKPVVYVTFGSDPARVPFCTSIAPGCLEVPCLDDIRPAIRRVLDSPDLQRELVDRGQAYLDRFLGPRDGGATRRLAALLAAAAGTRP